MSETGLMVYFAVVYILWGTTYTMMDIPYWSMIPALSILLINSSLYLTSSPAIYFFQI